MIESDILDLIAGGESGQVEFNEGWNENQPERLAREIAGFVNMQGGYILIGVSDAGDIVGADEDKEMWLMDTVVEGFIHPYIRVNYETVKIKDKKIAILYVPMGTAKPYRCKHNDSEDIYVRVGNVCRKATLEQQRYFFETGNHLSAEKLSAHGTSLDILDKRRLWQYFSDKLKLADEWEKDSQVLMCAHSVLIEHRSGQLLCSYFACLLFGKHPCLYLPQTGIRLTVFRGTEKDRDSVMDETLNMPFVELLKDKDSSYSEPSLVDQALKYLTPYISRDELNAEVSMRRQRCWDYPSDAVRELIVNAYAHRDWTRQRQVEVTVYSDRMEVFSPGALPRDMTVEKIKSGERTPRNNKICNILTSYGYIEERGRGIRRTVIRLMQEENNNEPSFDATEDHFRVTLYKKTDRG